MIPDSPPSAGLLLVLSAPSGTGKTTLARRLIDQIPEAIFSVSFTTRGPRGSEQDGIDYHFVDVPTFHEKIRRGEFVEWAEVHGQFYGSPQSVVHEALRRNKGLAVFDIDVQGGRAIKSAYPQTALVFVLPPSMEELERRLRERKTESEGTIQSRLLAARSEIERGLDSYDYFVVNQDLERAYSQLYAILVAERCRRGRLDLAPLKLDRPASERAKGS